LRTDRPKYDPGLSNAQNDAGRDRDIIRILKTEKRLHPGELVIDDFGDG